MAELLHPKPGPVPKPKRQYVRRGATPEERLARQLAQKLAVAARREENAKARVERVRLRREASAAAQKALQKAIKEAERQPDPEDTPERQAQRQIDRMNKGKAKGKLVLPGRLRAGSIDAMDVALILSLKDKEATNKEIAAALNVGVDTVARVLVEFADTRLVAKKFLQSKAETIAHHAVTASEISSNGGKGETALELLDRLDVAPKRVEEAAGSKTLIIVGSADGKGLPRLPIISAEPIES